MYDLMLNKPSLIRKIVLRTPSEYQWVQSDDRTFVFLPGEGKAWGPIEPAQGEVRYSINSYLPIETGVMDQANGERRWMHGAP